MFLYLISGGCFESILQKRKPKACFNTFTLKNVVYLECSLETGGELRRDYTQETAFSSMRRVRNTLQHPMFSDTTTTPEHVGLFIYSICKCKPTIASRTSSEMKFHLNSRFSTQGNYEMCPLQESFESRNIH